jgi:hypothetical protein
MIVDATAYAVQARARLWNLMLGGNEAYDTERWLLAHLRDIAPDIARLAVQEHAFVHRFWRFVTGMCDVQQIVYIGAPLPAGHPPHKALARPGRVVYVEGDPLLAAKGAAYLSDRDSDVVHVDPLDVDAMVDAVGIDWLEPVAVIAPGVLHWLDEGRARTWVTRVAGELPPRSFLAATHFFDPGGPDTDVLIERLLHRMDGSVGAAFFRRRAAIEALFPGLMLETPGVTLAVDWWPNGPQFGKGSLADQLLAAAVVAIPRSP